MSYANTKLLVPFAGNNNDTSTDDISPLKVGAFTAGGTAVISSDQSKFYGVSGKFSNTSGNYFTAAHDRLVNIGTGDFTISLWVRINSIPANNYGLMLIGDLTSNNSRIQIDIDSAQESTIFAADDAGSSAGIGGRMGPVPVDTWTHLAWTRSGGTMYRFLNGSLDASHAAPTALPLPEDMPDIYFGAARAGSVERHLDGFLQDCQIIVGEALWTSGFTPPGQLAHTYSGTVKDGAGNPLERTVRIHDRDSGLVVVETNSDISGDWSALGANVEATGVALGSSGNNENAAVLDRVAAT